jgi:peptide/nickel transport system substrate-binding protein
MAGRDSVWQHVVRGRANRRTALRGAVYTGSGLAAAVALACGGDSDGEGSGSTAPGTGGGTAAAAQDQPRRGGMSRGAVTTPYNDVMDPHTSLNQGAVLWSYIGNTALRLNREATELEPELVQKWEIPGDGSEILLTIRQNVKWHDKPPISGRAFDAQDLAYNLMRIAGKLNPNEAARFQRRTDLEGMNRAEAVDATTVKVTFDRPASTFLNGLTNFRSSLIPRDFLDKGGKFEDPASMVGTGAFVLDTFKDLERALYKRNPNYWKAGADGQPMPYVDGIEWVWLGDTASTLAAFIKGDIVSFVPNQTERDTIKKTVRGAQEEVWIFGNWTHLRLNLQRRPFTDARVRRALQLAINYKAINDAFYGEGYWDYTGPCPAVFPEAIQIDEIAKLPGWNPATKDADIKTAKDLLTAAGFPDGNFGFKIMPPSASQAGYYYDSTIRIIDQLKRIWPAMQPELDLPADGATFARRQVQGDFDVINYVIFPAPDAWLDLSSQYLSTGSRNYAKFKDDRIDSLLNTAFSQLDRNQRAGILKEVQRALINEHMPIITSGMPRQYVWFQAKVRGMKDYGGRADGGSYDTLRHAEHLWFGS